MSPSDQTNLYPWLQKPLSLWQQSVNAKRIAHSILITGNQGIGKLELGQHIAKILLCETGKNTARACGHCKDCRFFDSGNHPDFRIVEPAEKGKQIGVDAIRESSEFIYKTSQQGAAKVLLINPAEMMNINASNALLKTLEEPVENSYLILISHSYRSLLSTVISRCQRLACDKPSQAQSLEWLKAQVNQEDLVLNQALQYASGNVLLAKALIADDQLEQFTQIERDLCQIKQADFDFVDIAKSWKSIDPNLLFSYLIHCLHTWVRKNLDHSQSDDMDDICQQWLNVQSATEFNEFKTFRLYQQVLKTRELAFSRSNIQPELLLENLLIHWRNNL